MFEQTEIWKPIDDFPHYEISNLGNVRNKCGKSILPFDDKRGYLRVDLWMQGKRTHCKVHRLVAIAFLPPHSERVNDVNHINLDKHDCRAVNLEWVTHSQNVLHYFAAKREAKAAVVSEKHANVPGF